jgi:hypothetical protein
LASRLPHRIGQRWSWLWRRDGRGGNRRYRRRWRGPYGEVRWLGSADSLEEVFSGIGNPELGGTRALQLYLRRCLDLELLYRFRRRAELLRQLGMQSVPTLPGGYEFLTDEPIHLRRLVGCRGIFPER